MYNPYTKIELSDFFLLCWLTLLSGIDYADIKHMEKTLSTISSFYVYDCSTENTGQQDQFHPCFYCNIHPQIHLCSFYTEFAFWTPHCTLVKSVTDFCLTKRYTFAHLSQKIGVITILHVMFLWVCGMGYSLCSV